MEDAVQEIRDQRAHDRQVLLGTMQQMVKRFEALEQSLRPDEIPRWKAALNRLKGLMMVLAGATGGSLYEAIVQEKWYPEFKEELQYLLDRIDQVLGQPARAASPPTPTPEPTPRPPSSALMFCSIRSANPLTVPARTT